jgi:hypothetical protein
LRQKAQQIRRDLKIIDLINEEAAGHQLPLPFHTILLEILCKDESHPTTRKSLKYLTILRHSSLAASYQSTLHLTTASYNSPLSTHQQFWSQSFVCCQYVVKHRASCSRGQDTSIRFMESSLCISCFLMFVCYCAYSRRWSSGDGNIDTKFYWDLTPNIYRFSPMREEGRYNAHMVDERVGMKEHIEA